CALGHCGLRREHRWCAGGSAAGQPAAAEPGVSRQGDQSTDEIAVSRCLAVLGMFCRSAVMDALNATPNSSMTHPRPRAEPRSDRAPAHGAVGKKKTRSADVELAFELL